MLVVRCGGQLAQVAMLEKQVASLEKEAERASPGQGRALLGAASCNTRFRAYENKAVTAFALTSSRGWLR